MNSNVGDRYEFIDFYAKMIREDKNFLWRKEHKIFIDSQVKIANEFYIRLILTKNGVEKFMRVTGASESFAKKFYDFALKKSCL